MIISIPRSKSVPDHPGVLSVIGKSCIQSFEKAEDELSSKLMISDERCSSRLLELFFEVCRKSNYMV